MDIYTATEEAYKRGKEDGERVVWHDSRFRPDPGVYYCVRKLLGKDTDGGPVISEPRLFRYAGGKLDVRDIVMWFRIPGLD